VTQPSKAVGLIDVARRAGVSPATASRALSDAYGVSPATRERVLAVAQELDYVASPEATRLARGGTDRVALVVPHLERWFFSAIVAGMESVLSDADLDVLLYHVDDLESRRTFFHELPARRKVDAVVVVAFAISEAERQRLETMRVTVIAAGGQNEGYPFVSIDDRKAGRQAVDHLLTLGHRRIAMLSTVDPDEPGWSHTAGRAEAYRSALAEAGLPVEDGLVETVEWGGNSGAQGMAQLLARRNPPTAVYAHSDEVALGAIRTIRRAGLRVPQDISVVGIDDHPLADLTDLTTVHQPVRAQGARTAEMLLKLLRGEPTDTAVVVPTHLVVRGSTAPPNAS
jgi:DNA-binding LacI/PurR family transcriptional regulator